MQFTTDNTVFLFSILLILGVLTTKFSSRLGLPSLVFYIGVGMVLSRFIYYDNAALTQLFGIFALIVILFEGGMQTKWSRVKRVIAPSVSLATLGVLLTTAVVGAAATFILQVTWLEGMLFGAIVGSTDAAAVFAVLGSKNIKQRLSSTLEAESGTNDPMAVFLTVALIELLQNPEAKYGILLLQFILQMGLGLTAGLIMGRLAVKSVNRINLDSSGLYPVFAIAFAIFTYSATAMIGGSGLLAVYIMALIVGNSDLTYKHSIIRFHEGFAWMMQILMFILLGLLVFPENLLQVIWQGILLSLILMFAARPIGVFLSTMGMGFSTREKVVISWAGLRGAVPIVLATYPLLAGLDIGQMFFDAVFFVVLTSALIQGATISPLAEKLGLAGGSKPVVPHSLELVSIGKTSSEILETYVEEHSPAAGKSVKSIPFPNECLVTAVIRGDRVVTPNGNTRLKQGDTVYLMINKREREHVKRLFAGIDAEGDES
ncbi:potassium/proton antiporter [Paenibacillus sambharensis]|uniref:Potassium/proton antiporter n=1 Tax=Paenibacillus sambharensis TaxID=1803190 RepID=A0A2W1LQD6_9BACL|nr:potassium/proton antiporter [Paenibacillus sambharensis]PZD97055.1 potassium/proton antiporter [Paenibacillus sambharensis]